jgi:leucyl-tRNA synthetase
MAIPPYDPAAIEPKWQAYWEKIGLFRADPDERKLKYYVLCMYPYPSGVLHMGHVINYTIGDVLVRYRIMRGYNVFSPMGWDSFGLPAENAAIRLSRPPAEFTGANIDRMRQQMKRAGWGYDWRREVACSHPGYYRWTQWLFLRFFKAGMAVKKRAPVNWCPSCQTVLANEQVIDNACERCGTQVEQRDLEQWFFAMSRDAQRLLDNHAKLKGLWPDRVLKMQQEWIGRSEGARIDFRVAETGDTLSCFTTRPDTLYGVTFMSLAPEHPIIEKLLRGAPRAKEVLDAVRDMRRLGTAERERIDMEKRGVFTGRHVINPVNGDRVPLWVANFAVMTYGTGAVMSVPAHDQRDFEFARRYGLPIKVVIQPDGPALDPATMTQAYEGDGLQVNSGPFNGMPNRPAMRKIAEHLARSGWGEAAVTYRLRDWLLSRQRYWGAPIPIIYCDACGMVAVPDKDLPVLLPANVEFRPTGESPLARCEEFVRCSCPQCGRPARRETDTMDTFVDSSWYFLRYVSPRDERQPWDPKDAAFWLPVDQYVGGIEHATMHLIYCRFFTHVLYDLGLVGFDEPATRLFCQGMVCKEAYYCGECKWLPESDVESGRCRRCGCEVRAEIAKMSKTKLNTVSPDEIMAKYGADTQRLYILSDSPPERDTIWSEQNLLGANRMVHRLWNAAHEHIQAFPDARSVSRPDGSMSEADRGLLRAAHRAIKSVTDDVEREMHFNTAIARINELLNEIRSVGVGPSPGVVRFAFETVVRLLCPIIPHVAEELWQALGNPPSIFRTPWPAHDEAALQAETVTIPVQVNGKLRSHVTAPADASDQYVERLAREDPKVLTHIEGRRIRKVLVVGRKMVNIVVS